LQAGVVDDLAQELINGTGVGLKLRDAAQADEPVAQAAE